MDSIIKGLIIGVFSGIFAGIVVLLIALLQPTKYCPKCGKPFPKFGVKRTRKQMLSGGAICSHCGCVVDRHGQIIE